MKIMTVFGTRPEAIKMCPVILELKKYKSIETIVCLTGQHREMLSQVMNVFGICEDYNLEIMKENQTLAMITSAVLTGIDNILEQEKPDVVLVHGDTSTSFATAVAAFYRNVKVGHIEAGLRTYNLQSPFPEEYNRQVVDLISDYYFTPTETAKRQLLKEGKKEECIYVTGNTVIDALNTTVTDDYTNEYLSWAEDSKLILVTAHRRENLGLPMENICKAIDKIVQNNRDVKVIYPMHKNPKVRENAIKYLGNHERIKLIEPLDVFDFHNFINNSCIIMTDSGGVQEEAPSLGKPVLVLRDTTERPEGVEAGTLKLVGTNEKTIYVAANELLHNEQLYNQMSKASNPYGDGHASERIVNILINKLK